MPAEAGWRSRKRLRYSDELDLRMPFARRFALALLFAPGIAFAQQTPTQTPPAQPVPNAPGAAQDLPDSPGAQTTPTVEPTGPTAVLDTSMGRITCRLFDKQAPLTVANFIGLAEGHEGLDRSRDAREGARQAALRRHDISPRDSRLHGAGRRSYGDGHGRSGLLHSGRDRSIVDVRCAGTAGDGELRAQYGWIAVLRHGGDSARS